MLTAAACVMIATALVHSIGGELLWMRHLGTARFSPFETLGRRTVHVTWHLASIMAGGFAMIVLRSRDPVVLDTIAIALGACSLCVLVATRARHPGWLALAAAAVLTYLGAR